MTVAVVSRQTLPKPVSQLLPQSEVIAIQETKDGVFLKPINKEYRCPLIGLIPEPTMTVDEFIAQRDNEREQ